MIRFPWINVSSTLKQAKLNSLKHRQGVAKVWHRGSDFNPSGNPSNYTSDAFGSSESTVGKVESKRLILALLRLTKVDVQHCYTNAKACECCHCQMSSFMYINMTHEWDYRERAQYSHLLLATTLRFQKSNFSCTGQAVALATTKSSWPNFSCKFSLRNLNPTWFQENRVGSGFSEPNASLTYTQQQHAVKLS